MLKSYKELERNFAKTLFCEEDIKYVSNQIYENNAILYGKDCSLENKDKIVKVKEKIKNLHSTDVNRLFKEYEDLLINSMEQENCLAYYLGLRKGIEFSKIK